MPDTRKRQRTAILTDSAAGMPSSMLAKHGIHVAPMTIRVGHDEIVDTPGTDHGGIYEAVRRNPNLPVTVSAPLPQVWRDAIASIASASNTATVLIIAMSAQFSASYDAARVGAAWAIEQHPDVRVEVIDSGAFAGAQALVCTAAAESAGGGADFDAASRAATDASREVQSVTMLGSLAQINRVTRLPKFALATVRNMPIKPVVSFSASGWSITARPITRRSGINKVIAAATQGLNTYEPTMQPPEGDCAEPRPGARSKHERTTQPPEGNGAAPVDHATSSISTRRAIVMHVQNKRDAQRVAEKLANAHPTAGITICEMHPFAGVPAGTGTVGVAWL